MPRIFRPGSRHWYLERDSNPQKLPSLGGAFTAFAIQALKMVPTVAIRTDVPPLTKWLLYH